jgi:acyl carrier protein
VSIAIVVEDAMRSHVGVRVAAIAVELGADPQHVAVEARFEDLGFDSLALAELVQILELEFDLKLFNVAHGRLHTLGDAVDLTVEQLS